MLLQIQLLSGGIIQASSILTKLLLRLVNADNSFTNIGRLATADIFKLSIVATNDFDYVVDYVNNLSLIMPSSPSGR